MYPSVPGVNDPPHAYGYGNMTTSSPQYPAAGAGGASNLASASSLDASPWGTDSSSILRVKIAEDYKLDAPVPVPPALAASSKSQQDFDYEYERKVMSNDASTSFDAFLAKPETAYYDSTKASRFIRAGFSPAIVNMALAYNAANRGGDESQIMTFCENLKTLTDDMSFSLSLAAGALADAKNDLSAAANLCTELS